MTTSLIEIIILLILVLVNGLLAMSEIAVVSSRRVRLQRLAEEGTAGAETVLELLNRPTAFLSTVQIGITLVGILTGAFGGATLAQEIGAGLARVPGLANYADPLAFGLVVVSTTYFSLVLGELAPKQLALTNPERIAASIASPLKALARITAPVVRLLSLSTSAVLWLLGVRRTAVQPLTEKEIESLIEQGTRGGVFDPAEEGMVKQIFRVNERRIESLMTPRAEIVWLDVENPLGQLESTILSNRHTLFPVARGDLDYLVGVVQAKDLLALGLSGQPMKLDLVLQEPLIVPESTPAFEVLDRFREHQARLAMIIDEFGGIQGLVTTTDLLEGIVGALPEAGEPSDPDIVRRADGSYLLDGMLPVGDVKDLLGLRALPGEEKNYFQTLGGFVLTQLGRIPSTGDHFAWEGLRFEIVDMDGRRVDKILVMPWDEPES